MDQPKYHDWLSKDQLEAIIPRVVTAPGGAAKMEALIPRIFIKKGGDGRPCLVFRIGGSFHVFSEIEAKNAALDCGLKDALQRQSNEAWRELWDTWSPGSTGGAQETI
jgi:hypothetical protein